MLKWSAAVATPCSQEQLEQIMEQFTGACRSAGLKVTHQRTEIYRQLLVMADHPSAETLHRRLLMTLPSISLDTVYRTLTTLEGYGLVARIQTAESQARFEVVRKPHHHLICSSCKRVMDFHWPAIDSLELPYIVNQWGRINSKTIVMYGSCKQCSVG
ncbi:MAG: Fur family transcriptional regulator [Desulfuromonadaceae bacterium]